MAVVHIMGDVAGRGAGWWRTFIAVAAVALLLGVGALLVYVLLAQGLQPGVNVAAVVSVGLTIISLLDGVVGWWRRSRQPGVDASTDAQLDEAQRTLANQVRDQWESEVAVRQLENPGPGALVVRWRLTELDVMDHAENIAKGDLLRFDGSTDQIEKLARAFHDLKLRRLVIIGERGMGKTCLAVLMLLELLKHWEPGDPVPVFLSMSGWNPDEPLYDWLTRRLNEGYSPLRAAKLGPTAPKDLVARHRILPVLDGLDEIPDSLRPKALVALNDAMIAADPLILTCRTEEYKTAVTPPEGQPLRAGAVIEPSPLNAPDVANYLTRCLPVRPGGSWPDLLSRLSCGPIAEALATPLTLWLFRKVYIDTWTDPAELSDTVRFPTATVIKEHLLDRVIKALIVADSRRRSTEPDHPFHARYDWDPDDAQRWLGYLAHLNTPEPRDPEAQGPKPDLAWWQLYHAIPLRRIKVVVGLIAGLVFGLVVKPVFAPVFALVGGLVFGLGLEAEAKPAYANLRFRGRTRLLLTRFGLAFRLAFPLGLVSVPVFTLIVGLRAALSVGLTYALVGGIAFMFSDWITTPVSDDEASTPTSTLRSDLIVTGVHILAVGLTNTLALGFAFGLAFGLAVGITFALVGGLGSVLEVRFPFGLTVRVPFGFGGVGTAAVAYLTTVAMLSSKQRVPVRLMRFLDDSYRLGLLRQVGPIYQFRHAELQTRLALTYRQQIAITS